MSTATRACAAGGVTTSVAMPNVSPPPTTTAIMKDMFARYEAGAYVDWNVNPAPTVAEEIPGLADMGIIAYKIFMVTDTGRDYPHMPGIGIHDSGQLMAIMQRCAATGVPLMVHPHDQALMDHIEQEFWDRGERDALAYAKAYAAHDGLVWDSAIALLLRLQEATGVRLHLLHVQTWRSVEMIRAAKLRGAPISAEINLWALFLGHDWANIERLGSYALSYWVPENHIEPLWQGLIDGTIDIVATDHAPHTREEKEVGWTDGWKAHTGTPSTQFYLSLLLTEEPHLSATEPQRLALHATARAALGSEEGDTLMALTPPANTDIATMQALEHLEERLGASIDLAIGGLRVDIEAAGSRTLRWCVGAIIAAQAVTVGLLTLLLR